jgi:hypothetical protein
MLNFILFLQFFVDVVVDDDDVDDVVNVDDN